MGAVFMLICTVLNLVHVSIFKFSFPWESMRKSSARSVSRCCCFSFSGSMISPNCSRISAQEPPPVRPLHFWRHWLFPAGHSSVSMPARPLLKKLVSPTDGASHDLLSLCMVGSVVLFNSAALTLSFNRDTLQQTAPCPILSPR